MKINRTICLAMLLSAGIFAAAAQTRRTFEVASVKANNSGPGQGSAMLFLPGGGFRRTNASLKQLVMTAYDLQNFQISGATGWIDSDRYDVEAKAAANTNPSREDVLSMVQSLLTDRFKLRIHRETKEETQFVLQVARTGLKIKPAADPAGGVRGGANGRIIGKRTMPQLAQLLSGIVGRRVDDETGLTGIYEFTLEFLPESTGFDAPAPANPNAPSLFTALQEQLGLRLESRRGPVEVLVIDSAEKPSDN
jgi:bla regulator protein blaR1